MKWATLVISVLLFIGLALLIHIPIIEKYDLKWLEYVKQVRIPVLNKGIALLTDLGSIKFLLPFTIIAMMISVIKKYYLEGLFMLIVFWGARGMNALLKGLIARERPESVAFIDVSGYSFPSGHVMNSVVVFGFLYFLFTRIIFKKAKRWRVRMSIFIAFIVFFIALSRMYLGVHYLTDVVASVCAGYVFLLCMISLYEYAHDFMTKKRMDIFH